PFRISRKRGKALSLCFYAIPDGEPVSTSPGIAISPFAIGDVALRNRVVFQPHFTALGGPDGMPSDDHVAYHEERARGDVGLIILESMAIHPTGKMSRRFINAWTPLSFRALAGSRMPSIATAPNSSASLPVAAIPRWRSRHTSCGRCRKCRSRRAITRPRPWMTTTFAP
ncbi:MAG: hypothetical protein CMH13_12245, partial [Martelella sp.]|nr:hypothetical protein [Martelella sp.]